MRIGRQIEGSGYRVDMAIAFPDMEHVAYEAATSETSLPEARMALHAVVARELEHGVARERIGLALERLADKFAEIGDGVHEAAVLDVLDALEGTVMPSRRL